MNPFALVVEHTVDIDAPPARVYDVLTNTREWSEWSTMLQFRGGVLAVGEPVRLGLRTAAASYDFTARVTALEPDRAFEWLARTGLPGLFDGRHRFELTPLDGGGCRLRNVEWYTGLLVPVVSRTASMRAAPAGFVAMNEELRRRAQRSAAAPARSVVEGPHPGAGYGPATSVTHSPDDMGDTSPHPGGERHHYRGAARGGCRALDRDVRHGREVAAGGRLHAG